MVRGKKMKNPLRKRLPRELKTEFGKYLVIFLLLVATIGLVSGFLPHFLIAFGCSSLLQKNTAAVFTFL